MAPRCGAFPAAIGCMRRSAWRCGANARSCSRCMGRSTDWRFRAGASNWAARIATTLPGATGAYTRRTARGSSSSSARPAIGWSSVPNCPISGPAQSIAATWRRCRGTVRPTSPPPCAAEVSAPSPQLPTTAAAPPSCPAPNSAACCAKLQLSCPTARTLGHRSRTPGRPRRCAACATSAPTPRSSPWSLAPMACWCIVPAIRRSCGYPASPPCPGSTRCSAATRRWLYLAYALVPTVAWVLSRTR